MQYIVLWAWLLSDRIIQVIACIITLFLFIIFYTVNWMNLVEMPLVAVVMVDLESVDLVITAAVLKGLEATMIFGK